SILCSVTVSVLLKVARQNGVDIKQAIAFNYVTAITLCWFILQPDFAASKTQNLPWLLFAILGVLLPTIFIAMFKAVEFAGIVRADAAQRLSLFLPILASFTLFGEALSTSRGVSLAIAFIALFCLLWKPASTSTSTQTRSGALFLLLVWIGYGVIDILFKQMAKTGTSFPAGLFIAFALAGLMMFAYLFAGKARWNLRNAIGGLILGSFNFGNILFYIKAHQHFSQNPTLVFTTMNIGVISLGTLIGALVFKEKISLVNAAGIVLAIVAVLCLYYWVIA
ncbi:MAG: EamA/RhaT family transporter, partial [Alcaligenaceae bacterium]|nr:EamA/RhaT family transporter [Alcaligenaceae bacterium]